MAGDRALFTVLNVRKETNGATLDQAVTTGSPADGENLEVESVADFDGNGGKARLYKIDVYDEDDPATYEEITYRTTDETTDRLVGITRGAVKAFSAGETFVQEGSQATLEKVADGKFDAEEELITGVPIPADLYAYFKLGARDDETAETVWVDVISDEDDQIFIRHAPVGAVPNFDEDGEVLPPINAMPGPEDPASGGKKPAAPTISSAVSRVVLLVQPTWFIDVAVAHSGLYDDGTEVNGLSFRYEFLEGAAVKYRSDSTGTFFSKLVEGSKTYTVRVYAMDFAGVLSAPVTTSVTTSPDTTPPATPAGLALTGGANGGGSGILFGTVTPNTEIDFSHYEVHASTSSGFTPSAATKVMEVSASNFALIKAHNGSTLAAFGYTTTVYVKLKAVDTQGNVSAASSQASGSAAQIQSADVADIQSDNFVTGSAGWKISKNGNAEFQNGTFRGTVVAGSVLSGTFVSMSSSGAGSVVMDGANNRITLGGGALILSGAGSGSIAFGSGGIISGSGAGAIAIGSGIDLDGSGSGQIQIGSGLTLDGAGTGTITGGLIRTASSGWRVELGASYGGDMRFYDSGGTQRGSLGLSSGGSTTVRMQAVTNSQVYCSTTEVGLGGSGIGVHALWTLDVDNLLTAKQGVVVDAGSSSVNNHVTIRSAGGDATTPSTGRCSIYYDASVSPPLLRARNSAGTMRTLATF